MLRYFISIGSNINPFENVVHVIEQLFTLAPVLHVSRVVKTDPVSVDGDGQFLNLSVGFEVTYTPAALKTIFNTFETQLGRDRSDNERKTKSRTADLDILFWLQPEQTAVSPQKIPTEPYMRPMLLELLHWLKIESFTAVPALPPGIPLKIGDTHFGRQPLSIQRPISKTPNFTNTLHYSSLNG